MGAIGFDDSCLAGIIKNTKVQYLGIFESVCLSVEQLLCLIQRLAGEVERKLAEDV